MLHQAQLDAGQQLDDVRRARQHTPSCVECCPKYFLRVPCMYRKAVYSEGIAQRDTATGRPPALFGVAPMTTTHPAAARIVRHESALTILIVRRNLREHRHETRFCIRRHVAAVRVLRTLAN